MNSPTTNPPIPRTAGRPFDAVMIALSAALLVIFGVVIGRFAVTTQAVEIVDHFDSSLSTLREEVVELNRQLLRTQSQADVLQDSSDGYRRLATQQQARADRLAVRQVVLGQTIDRIAAERQTCLAEIQQYVALDRSIPAGDVLRFAEEMFDTHAMTLQQLSSGDETVVASLPSLPRLHVTGNAASTTDRDARTSHPPTGPTLAGPTFVAAANHTRSQSRPAATTTSVTPTPAKSGVYFAPPLPRRRPSGYTFFTPRRNSEPVVTFARPSGVTFHGTADASDTVRR